ncbi:conjugal transfer protein TraD [Agrobacterium tumefaciens]|uniref:Conjugal transfer protein TraD n=1 Tax=Agrobacterium tumefaciens TaxID=358 RepID=A0AA44JEC6_AGRTU|nr:conjugal transfer protein TraD [Agrobacterium tumefaciens]NTB87800.1 conjugal transfer protein TraD [Agrobacterium tumefaciens]NTC32112.1 conjugal transfer protein TraD [Agrobacterium tumefaciens]
MQSARNEDRKKDTREKIQLGGLVVKAGLRDIDKAVLLGWLMELPKHLNDAEGEWARLQSIGKRGFEDVAQEDDARDRADRLDAGNSDRNEGD